jgi:hypothetical protein
VIPDVEIDQHVNRAACGFGGFGVPRGLLHVIDYDYGAGLDDPRHFERVGDGRGQQQAGDSGGRHHLGFGERRDTDSIRAGGDLALGNLCALVRFCVGSQTFAGLAGLRGEARQVGFEFVEIQQKGRGGQLAFR